jgi:hypothetical protein
VAKLSDAEILFIFVSACLEYGSNCRKAMEGHKRHGNIKQVLDKSQFNRRLHRLQAVVEELVGLFCTIGAQVGEHYALDSFPLPVCRNIRIKRCKLAQGPQYHGYCASKQEYYYGFKVYLITAADGRIIEFEFTPAAVSDTAAFNLFSFPLPAEKELFADKAYNNYHQEQTLREDGNILLAPIRKKNSKQADNTYVHNWLGKYFRKHIEANISTIVSLFPKKIHAVTKKGFLLKVLGFFLAHHFLFFI